jgi:hypothetical protein
LVLAFGTLAKAWPAAREKRKRKWLPFRFELKSQVRVHAL